MNKQMITYKELKKLGANTELLQFFNRFFGESAPTFELLKKCAKFKKTNFGTWLVIHLPFNEQPLKVDSIPDTLFYNGDVYIKNNIYYSVIKKNVCIKGSLNVSGKLIIYNAFLSVISEIKAESIEIKESAIVSCKNINAQNVNIYDKYSSVYGNIKANQLTLCSGLVYGDVDIKNLYSHSGYINGEININRNTAESYQKNSIW